MISGSPSLSLLSAETSAGWREESTRGTNGRERGRDEGVGKSQHPLQGRGERDRDHGSLASMDEPLVTLTPRTLARARISMRDLDETAWAISAAKRPECMRRRSISLALWTRRTL